ncbi:heat shock protein Hsp20 [Hoeflea marina]|uniref:Heat shock protein Hsp20 n=1 Tax=Hoeflea marina TaxID=274592 RepID=A0A317PWU6_9HYPH|nr:Hsp20/alpha crystallin family protein [Hoeflea marina]PWW03960.1 heat shock protein Hsp20 [Hoeflea marina]
MTDKSVTKSSPAAPSIWSSGLFGEFRKEMDTMLERFFGDSGTLAARSGLPSLDMSGALRPAIDVTESDRAITVTAELPGLTEDQVDLSISEGMLTLRGEKQVDHESKQDDRHLVERSYGSFLRQFPVPERVDVDAISAKFDRGVLVVTMPKKPGAAQSRRKIAIGG